MAKLPIGLSCCGEKSLSVEGFKQYKDNGIDFMEVSVGGYSEVLDYKLLKQNADETGVKLWSLHVPFAGLDPSALDEDKRRYTIDFMTRIMKRGADGQFEVAVIHPSGEPNRPEDRPRRLEQAKKSFKELADIAEGCGMTVAVEDLPRTCIGNCSGDILTILDADKRLRVCYDTNHLLEQQNVDFIKAVGDKIITTHVSDYDFLNERHWLPGEGKNDWNAILSALIEVGYTGPWLYELGFRAEATIQRPRKLKHSDFKRNADEIFEGKPLTVIGTPVAGLKHWTDK